MKEYSSDKIRNVAVVSHDGAGKTALVESLLLTSGAVDFVGKGQDNKHIMDFEPEEIKRNVTIQLGMAPCEWHDHKVNFVDTPGYNEFHGEVELTFDVHANGTISNIRVNKSMGAAIDEAAKKLLMKGPEWKIKKGKKTSASVTVQF